MTSSRRTKVKPVIKASSGVLNLRGLFIDIARDAMRLHDAGRPLRDIRLDCESVPVGVPRLAPELGTASSSFSATRSGCRGQRGTSYPTSPRPYPVWASAP